MQCSWFLIFKKIKANHLIHTSKYGSASFWSVFTGHLVDTFSLSVLKTMTSMIGITSINANLNLNLDLRKYYIFNNNIKTFDLNSVFLLMGCNPQVDSPILNMKLRQIKYKYKKRINVGYVGSKLLINYSMVHLGLKTSSMMQLFYGKSFFCKIISKINNVVCLYSVGLSYLLNHNLPVTLDLLSIFLRKHNFIQNHLSIYTSDVSLHELGVNSYYYYKSTFIRKFKAKFFLFLGVDYNNMCLSGIDNYVIYNGHHANVGVSVANVILPSNLYVENTCFFLNCEGRLMVSNVAITKKKKIVNNESVIYNLFNFLCEGEGLLVNLRRVFLLFFYKTSFFFTKYKYVVKTYIQGSTSCFFSDTVLSVTNDFYNMDVISKSSYYLVQLRNQETSLNF